MKRLEFFEEMDEIFEALYEGLRHGEIRNPEEPIYYGLSIRVGPDGVPRFTQFGNVEPALTDEVQSEPREPFSDLIVDDKEKEVIVTMEMPGIEKRDINIETTESLIEVNAETKTRKYHKKVQLEPEIRPKSAKATLNNGVLEIKAKLKGPGRKSKKVKVE